MNIKNHLIVKDNFFDDETFKKIKEKVSSLPFTNRYVSEKNSVYQQIYFQHILNKNDYEVNKLCEKLNYYGIKVDNINSQYFLSTKHKDPTPHTDYKYNINCLVYIKGKSFINSGTGFYDVINNEIQLNTHIGFKENRAIIFDSDLMHCSLQFTENTLPRYVMANFINERI